MRPVVVYLDTQDYIRMHNAQPGSSAYDIKQYLIDATRNGTVICGISFIAYFEFLQADMSIDRKHREERYRRAQLLEAICGTAAFPWLADLHDRSHASPDRLWMPRHSFLEFNIDWIIKTYGELLRKELNSPNVNISIPRRIRRALPTKSGLTDLLRANPRLLLEAMDLADSKIADLDVPIPRLVRGYLLEKKSKHQVNSELRLAVLDPKRFYDIWFEYGGLANPLDEFKENVATALASAATTLSTISHQRREILSDLKREEQSLRIKISSGQDSSGWARMLEKYLRHHRQQLSAESERYLQMPDRKYLPHPDAHLVNRHFSNVMKAVVSTIQCGHLKPQLSLSGDVLHAAYLPVCDLWRSDVAFANALVAAKVPNFEKIVPRLDELPNRIGALQISLN